MVAEVGVRWTEERARALWAGIDAAAPVTRDVTGRAVHSGTTSTRLERIERRGRVLVASNHLAEVIAALLVADGAEVAVGVALHDPGAGPERDPEQRVLTLRATLLDGRAVLIPVHPAHPVLYAHTAGPEGQLGEQVTVVPVPEDSRDPTGWVPPAVIAAALRPHLRPDPTAG